MTPDQKIAVINQGRMANLVAQHFGQLIKDRQDLAFQRLKQLHLSKDYDVAKLAAGLAAVCELDDLQRTIQMAITRATQLKGDEPA